MALAMIFVTAQDEPTAGSPVEGAGQGSKRLRQLVALAPGFPHCLVLSALIVGKSRRPWEGMQAVNNMGRIKGNLLLRFLSWLDILPT